MGGYPLGKHQLYSLKFIYFEKAIKLEMISQLSMNLLGNVKKKLVDFFKYILAFSEFMNIKYAIVFTKKVFCSELYEARCWEFEMFSRFIFSGYKDNYIMVNESKKVFHFYSILPKMCPITILTSYL